MDTKDTLDRLELLDPLDDPIDPSNDLLDTLEPVEQVDLLDIVDPEIDRLAAIFYGGQWEDASQDAKDYQRALIRTALMGGHG